MDLNNPNITGNELQEVKAKRDLHRLEKHNSMNLDEFFDCASCGLFDGRISRLERQAKAEGRA